MTLTHPIREVVRDEATVGACALTAILVIVGDFAEGEKSLRCLSQQSNADQMELILASDRPDVLALSAPLLPAFGAVQLILGDVRRLPHLRAACAERARAPIVAFNEDHSFVEAEWCACLLRAFASDDRVVAVAAGMANPNSRHPVSRAQFAAFFARFTGSAWSEGEHDLDVLPWHNTVYRLQALRTVERTLGASTGQDLEVEGTLQTHLREALPDGRFVLTTRTTVHHVNVSRLAPAVRHAVLGGRLFAAERARRQQWGPARRLLQAAASPLVPFVRLWRDRHRIGVDVRGPADHLNLLAHAFVMASGHAAGEALGLLAGSTVEHVQRYADFECRRARFVQPSDRALLFP